MLLDDFQAFVRHLPGFEHLNTSLHMVPKGRRADYAILDRRVIIEQKHTRQIEAARKRINLEARFAELTGKTNLNIGQILEEIPQLETRNAKELTNLANRHTKFVQDAFSDADSQIDGTNLENS